MTPNPEPHQGRMIHSKYLDIARSCPQRPILAGPPCFPVFRCLCLADRKATNGTSASLLVTSALLVVTRTLVETISNYGKGTHMGLPHEAHLVQLGRPQTENSECSILRARYTLLYDICGRMGAPPGRSDEHFWWWKTWGKSSTNSRFPRLCRTIQTIQLDLPPSVRGVKKFLLAT